MATEVAEKQIKDQDRNVADSKENETSEKINKDLRLEYMIYYMTNGVHHPDAPAHIHSGLCKASTNFTIQG